MEKNEIIDNYKGKRNKLCQQQHTDIIVMEELDSQRI